MEILTWTDFQIIRTPKNKTFSGLSKVKKKLLKCSSNIKNYVKNLNYDFLNMVGKYVKFLSTYLNLSAFIIIY